MKKTSAGILLYRFRDGGLEVFLVHPGGPFWAQKDLGSWSIPKGEYGEEDALEAAKREFREETGYAVHGASIDLGSIRQASGKVVRAWAVEGDLDPSKLMSNLFELEWPPHSGRIQKFPEVDKGAWFKVPLAVEKIVAGQREFVERLVRNGLQKTNK